MSDQIMQQSISEDFVIINEFKNFYDEYLELNQVYTAGIKELRTKLEILDDEYRVKYDHSPIHHMLYRLKSPKSISNKLKKLGYDVTIDNMYNQLFDIAGIRIVCNYLADVYTIFNMIEVQDDLKILKVKDYIKNPKPSGYRSLHVIVEVPVFLSNGKQWVKVELQIRTIAMDFWASLEHDLRYKTAKAPRKELMDDLTDCAYQIASIDLKMQKLHNTIKMENENNTE